MNNNNSELQENKKNIARNNKRKAKKAMNLSDNDFYKKELKGLSVSQKSKMIRKRNQLLEKEKRKNRRNSIDKTLDNFDNKTDKSLVRNAGVNGYPSTIKKNPENTKYNKLTNEKLLDDSEPDFKDLTARGKLLGKIKTLKRKNKNKKRRKRTKRFIKIMSIPFGFSFVIGLVAFSSALLIFAGGMVASVAVSHPSIVKELYQTGVLGDVNSVTNLAKDVKVDGKVVAKGIGDKNNAGYFSYFGEYNDGTGVFTGGSTSNSDKDKDTGKEDSGSSVTEADESEMSGKIWNKLRSMGYSKQSTAGVMGNIQQESQFDINASNGTHMGLFQWDIPGRYANATKFCQEKGKDITKDFGCQIEFADQELSAYNFSNHRTKSFEGFKKSDSVQNVVYDFEELFERSGGSAMDKRLAFANAIFEKYGK